MNRRPAPSHRQAGHVNEQMRFHFPTLEIPAVQDRAKALGLTFSAYIRSLIEKDLQEAKP